MGGLHGGSCAKLTLPLPLAGKDRPPAPAAVRSAAAVVYIYGNRDMVRKLIDWAVGNPFIVLLLAAILAIVGGYAFWNVNVEAYPDPAPAIIEVIAQFPVLPPRKSSGR